MQLSRLKVNLIKIKSDILDNLAKKVCMDTITAHILRSMNSNFHFNPFRQLYFNLYQYSDWLSNFTGPPFYYAVIIILSYEMCRNLHSCHVCRNIPCAWCSSGHAELKMVKLIIATRLWGAVLSIYHLLKVYTPMCGFEDSSIPSGVQTSPGLSHKI